MRLHDVQGVAAAGVVGLPGTKVTVELGLRDVEGAPGVYGIQRRTVGFTVGRSQVSLVDAAAHTMEVRRNGELLTTVPITAGAPKTTTYNGKMVVTELYDVTRMDGRTVGFGGEYDIKDVPHAMRLTDSGTFLHGNYWADASTFGSAKSATAVWGSGTRRAAARTRPRAGSSTGRSSATWWRW
ncbi:hypothetical protein STANM309S_02237 [Streptomyces tanashiensis]